MQPPRLGTTIAGALCLLGLVGCSSFTEVGDAGGQKDAASPGDGPAGKESKPPGDDIFSPGGTGPGEWGALPSGYCCSSDSECRFRSCIDLNGAKMCSDPCSTDDGCKGTVVGLTCNTQLGRCEPETAGTACVPADTFAYGAKKLGQCCLATHDGWAGFECEGNHCVAFGDYSNPFICTHVCTKALDCPGNYACLPVDTYAICVPLAETYSCPP